MEAAAGEIIMDPLIAKIKREVGNLIDKIMEPVLDSIKREVGYLIGNLKKKRDGIEQSIYMIQEKDDATKEKGQDVYSHVTDTLTKAREMKTKIDGFLDGCSVGWCLDLVSRYRLNKEAVSMKNELDKIQQYISSTDDFQAFTSRARVFEEVMAAMKDDRVNMVGIYGLGGVGKTIMAEEIGKQLKIKGHFDEFVMAVVSHDVNWRNIQGRLADKLCLKLEKETEDGRAEELRKRLENGEKNLVILDDLWSKLDLKKIGIPLAGNAKGCKCKVLLTSRNERVFQDMNVENRSLLGVLDDEEALRLFHTKMGNSVFEIQESVVKDVCKECGRLPIAIVAVAKALNGKTKEAWIDASRRLKESMLESVPDIDPKVYQTLKLSYDLLEPEDARKCFLMCCLFPEDAEISVDELVRYGMGMRVFADYVYTLEHARDSVRSLVETLKNRSLLLDGHQGQNMCKMHDVIRDVAISIAKGEKAFLVKHGAHLKEWPEKDASEGCAVISLRSPNINGQLPDDLKCPHLHTLVLECPNAKIPDNFFSGMTQLRLLHMKAVDLRTLPSPLGSLSRLRMLCLENCKLEDRSLVGEDLKSLEMLSLVGPNIMKLPPELKHLSHLRLLDLTNCSHLSVIPANVISSLTRLEELLISDKFNKWEVESTDRVRINASPAELNSLAHLVVLEIYIPHASLLPDKLCIFDKLIRYKVSIGVAYRHTLFKFSPLKFRPFNRLIYQSSNKTLILSKFHARDDIRVLMKKAEYLELINLTGLANVLYKQDADLKSLFVENCRDLEYLSGEGARFSKLRDLSIRACRLLKYLFLPSTARSLKQLQRLEVLSCQKMEEIICSESDSDKDDDSNIIVFDQLKHLTLFIQNNLKGFYPNINKMQDMEATTSSLTQSLFHEKVAFPVLEELELESLSNTEIWDKSVKVKNSFGNLKKVGVQSCDKLVNVIPTHMTSKLCWLQILTVKNCESVVCIVEGIDNVEEGKECKLAETINLLPGLRKVELYNLERLTCLFGWEMVEYSGGQVVPAAVPNLTELSIKRCPTLRNVVSSSVARNLVQVRELRVSDCERMAEIVTMVNGAEVIVLPLLKTLRVETLPSLVTFATPDPSQKMGKVKTRKEDAMTQPLFDQKVSLPELENCSVSGVKSNVIFGGRLPLHSFDKLIELKIVSCDNLSTVVPADLLPRLQNLQSLIVQQCSEVTEVFELEGLNVSGGQVNLFSKLKYLSLSELPKLHCLWNNKDPDLFLCLQSLEVVEIKGCHVLRNLFSPSVVAALVRLRLLKVCSCKEMEEIVSNEEKERVMIDEIALIRLEDIVFEDLPNLKSFCNENYAFKLPSLRKLVLSGCRNIQNFISGKVSMPKKDVIDGNGNQLRDLNEYARQQAMEASQL